MLGYVAHPGALREPLREAASSAATTGVVHQARQPLQQCVCEARKLVGRKVFEHAEINNELDGGFVVPDVRTAEDPARDDLEIRVWSRGDALGHEISSRIVFLRSCHSSACTAREASRDLICDQIVTYSVAVEQGTEVFRALADPTRRELLDRLFSRDGQTLNELCENFPEMTRFGVMKHLSVLAEANLVVTARQGRTKRHYLNPVPIEQVANRWISKYAARFTSALVALDQQVSAGHGREESRRPESA
jgi:DNA-binding transcriptional ArsR family regulator